jgi:hypothetical protein
MKRLSVFRNVKSIAHVEMILASNYPFYSIDDVRHVKWDGCDREVVFYYLKQKGDRIFSLVALYNPNIEELKIEKMNGNFVRKMNRLLSQADELLSV